MAFCQFTKKNPATATQKKKKIPGVTLQKKLGLDRGQSLRNSLVLTKHHGRRQPDGRMLELIFLNALLFCSPDLTSKANLHFR